MIKDFDGETFVAFVDISGFKKLMKKGKKAWKVLDKFYQYGYEILKKYKDKKVEGIFISDSGILFVRDCEDKIECLKALLKVVKELNKKMLDHNVMLTTSIAYGRFKYQKRIEFVGIEKNPIYGNAYVSAYYDNEHGDPKIRQGECRIVKKNLPVDVEQGLAERRHDEILRMLEERENHYYFYWMIDNSNQIEEFKNEYDKAYYSRYKLLLKVLKGERIRI